MTILCGSIGATAYLLISRLALVSRLRSYIVMLLLMRATLGALHLVSAYRSESVKVFLSLQTRNIIFAGAIRVEGRAKGGALDNGRSGIIIPHAPTSSGHTPGGISLCQANARSHVVMSIRTSIRATRGRADYGRSYSINFLALPTRPRASVGRVGSGHARPGRLWACGFDQKLPTGHARPGQLWACTFDQDRPWVAE